MPRPQKQKAQIHVSPNVLYFSVGSNEMKRPPTPTPTQSQFSRRWCEPSPAGPHGQQPKGNCGWIPKATIHRTAILPMHTPSPNGTLKSTQSYRAPRFLSEHEVNRMGKGMFSFS